MYALDYEEHGISTLTGEPDEVSRRLHQVDAEQVIAVAIARATPREAAAIAQTFASIADLVKTIVGKTTEYTRPGLDDDLTHKGPPPLADDEKTDIVNALPPPPTVVSTKGSSGERSRPTGRPWARKPVLRTRPASPAGISPEATGSCTSRSP